MSPNSEDCAKAVLEVVPLVMRTIRTEMRRYRGPELAVPHFRVLAYLDGNEGASLSDVAEHLGLRLPSMSTLVAGLVDRKLVARGPSAVDRRRITLGLTARGRSTLAAAREATQARLAERLETLPAEELDGLIASLNKLRAIFASNPEVTHA
jgi:DNA-binding MarR family transcriptional regulator